MNDEFKPPHWSQFLGINFRKLGIGLVVIGVAAGLWFPISRVLQKRLEVKLLDQATAALKARDFESANLTLRQLLKRNPANLQANVMMANLAEAHGSRAAVLWFEQVCELEPQNLDNHLRWAATALRFGELEAMERALARIKPRAAHSPKYHDLMGTLAVAQRRYKEAETHFQKAAELAPNDDRYQLNLAVVVVQSGSGESLAAARSTLSRLATNQVYAVDALRTLTSDALRRKDYAEVVRHGKALLGTGKADVRDHINHLQGLLQSRSKELNSALGQAQSMARKFPGAISELAGWMCQNEMGEDCLKWLDDMDGALKASDVYHMARSATLVHLKRWSQLQSELNKENWKELEFLRLAYLSRAERGLNNNSAYVSHWREAQHAVRSSTAAQFMLARAAKGWRWEPEAEALYWTIVGGSKGRLQALGTLHKLYMERKDESQLLRVTRMLADANEEDLLAKNNLAQLLMLSRMDLEKAHRIAEQNHLRFPSNSAFRSTYAFALYQQGKIDDALKIFQGIPERNLKFPSLAGYYGLLLEAARRGEEAKPFLDTALASDDLLPSEAKLIKSARARLP